VTLAVGEEAFPLVVREKVSCEHTMFFRLAVKWEWQEGKDRRTPLPDDLLPVVVLYVQWVYCDRILSYGEPNPCDNDNWELDWLINAFVFGENI